jgi:predicted small lipoprotein YifL
MKKIIALLLAAILVLSMAACGKGKSDPNPATPDEATPDQATEPATEFVPFVPELGEGVYGKTSYTVSDQQIADNRDLVVATVGDRELTLGVLQIYYWMDVYGFLNEYGAYASYFGLDLTQPLDQQQCPEGEGTWQQYFLDRAVNTWHSYQGLVLQSEAEQSPMDPEMQKELDELETNMTASAQSGGFESLDAMLQAEVAPGITFEDYYTYLSVYSTGYSHYMYRCDNMEITQDMIDAYFKENEETLAESEITKDSGKVVDVRHILIAPQGGTEGEDGTTTYSEDEWAACEKKAQDLLDRYLNGDKTEEFFADLAELYTDDPGSKETGGLYEDVKTGVMVEEFDAWCFDDSRKVGDTGLVKTTYGYHVMFYSGDEALWIYECREAVRDQEIGKFVNEAVAAQELKADFGKMMLGHRDLAG